MSGLFHFESQGRGGTFSYSGKTFIWSPRKKNHISYVIFCHTHEYVTAYRNGCQFWEEQ